MMDAAPDRPLNRKEATEYLLKRHGIRRTTGTLAKLAVIGGGPAFRRAGRIPLYDPPDLDAYAAEITSPPVRSTSELPRRERSAPPRPAESQRNRAERARSRC
jgi:hypothetical protein